MTPLSQAETKLRSGLRLLIVSALLLASFGLAVLGFRPDLDLTAAEVFFVAPGHFLGSVPQVQNFRLFAAILPFIVYFGAILLYAAGEAGVVPARFALSRRGLIFLTLSLALGPGLLVNEVFKREFHRPRPVHVEVFGGVSSFRPLYRRDGDCAANCSFPSGETSAAFWLMAPAVLTPPPLRIAALATAMLFGAATGLTRMAAGAHFLSDILFSGLLTGLITIGLWFVTRPNRPGPSRAAPAGLQEDPAAL
jgi:lipid A 4'-phosphatase